MLSVLFYEKKFAVQNVLVLIDAATDRTIDETAVYENAARVQPLTQMHDLGKSQQRLIAVPDSEFA